MGESMTAGLVNPSMTFHAGKEQVIHGVFQKIVDRLKDMNGYDEKTKAFDPEIMKLVADRMINEVSVRLFLQTCVIDTLTEGNIVCGVEIHNKSGRGIVLSRVVLDGTGVATWLLWLGLPSWLNGNVEL